MTKTKIAIVEDDVAIAQMYRLKFEAENFDVAVAENGIIGLELIKEFNPDVVLLDMMMPEMNGDEVLSQMRGSEWGKDTLVLILTNMGKEEAPSTLDSFNVHSYIVKAEMTPKQVASRVKEALEGN
jgi:DNA-binding response OmpR family regulator